MRKEQLKAARALKGWNQDDFAAVSGVSAPTIKRIESGSGELHASPDVLEKIRRALELHGIEIQDPDEFHGMGVRLRDSDEFGRLSRIEAELLFVERSLQTALRYTIAEERLKGLISVTLEAALEAQREAAKCIDDMRQSADQLDDKYADSHGRKK